MAKSNKSWLEKFRESESSTSVIFGAIVVIVVGILLFNYSRSNPSISNNGEATESAAVTSPTGIKLPTTHVVTRGETLWAIATKYYGNGEKWSDLAKENDLGANGSVDVGQVLKVPALTNVEAVAPMETKEVTPASEELKEVVKSPAPTVSGKNHTVVAGDSLWKIAMATYNDGYKWNDIYKANQKMIADPDLIYPGQILVLP